MMTLEELTAEFNRTLLQVEKLGIAIQNWQTPPTVPNVVASPAARQGFGYLIQSVEGLRCMCACMSRPGATLESCAQECDCGPALTSKQDDTK